MRSRIETGPGQQEFVMIGSQDDPEFQILSPLGEPAVPTEIKRIDRLITFSDIEKSIYQKHGVEPRDIISKGLAVGTAIDYFLIPANFIYRYRAKYCFPDDEDQFNSWSMVDAFKKFFPTGYPSERNKMLEFLEKYRRSFMDRNNPLNPEYPVLEKRGIRDRLVPLWIDVARTFRIDSLNLQGIMKKEDGNLVASDETASSEGIMDIAQRIVSERFYSLIEDDQDYSYYAKPDFLIEYAFEGKTFHIQVQPDYIKRLREERASVKKRIAKGEKLGKRIVVQRIVGDFKDTDKAELVEGSGPFIESMDLYKRFLLEIGRRGRFHKTTRIRFPNGQKRKTYIIPVDATDVVPANRVEAILTLLKAEKENMNTSMPKLTPITEAKAKETLEWALRNAS